MRTRTLAVIGLVAALTLSACSDDSPEPRFEPESSSAAATETPSSPTTETSETEAVGRTPLATVREWVKAYNSTLRTGDAAEARSLTSRCKPCDWQVDPVVEVHEKGGEFNGATWKIAAAEVTDRVTDDARAVVTAGIRVAGGTTIPERGAEPVSYDEKRYIVEFELRDKDDRWLLTSITYLS